MNILFKTNGNPYRAGFIEKCVRNFGKSYNETLRKIISNSSNGLNKKIFYRNVAMLMPNFMMGRAGPFKGIKYMDGHVMDPEGQIATCWDSIGKRAVKLKNSLIKIAKDLGAEFLSKRPELSR